MKRPVRALAPVARSAAGLVAALVGVTWLVAAAAPAHASGSFRFTDPDLRVTEGQAIARVVVERTDLPVSRVTVEYRTEAETASEGADFATAAGRLVFDVGERQATFVVYLRDDDVAEESEQLLVRLLAGPTATTTITIVDDDHPVEHAEAPAVAPPALSATAAEAPPTIVATAPGRAVVRRQVVSTRAAPGVPRRVTVRQSPVTPFELRPSPGTSAMVPGAVDPALALLAGLLLAKVAAEVWFRARTPAS